MSNIVWSRSRKIVLMSAQRTLGNLVKRLKKERPDWVVLMRLEEWSDSPFMYAFRPQEIIASAKHDPAKRALRAVEALDLKETGVSETIPPGVEPLLFRSPEAPPTRARAIRVNADGELESVGEISLPSQLETISIDRDLGLGPLRGGASDKSRGLDSSFPPSAQQERVDVMLSAEAPSEIAVGDLAVVTVLIELASDKSLSRGLSAPASISTHEQIATIITVYGGTVEAQNPRLLKLDPPQASKPSQSAFTLRGLALGRARIGIIFRQGGTELGTLTFSVDVTAGVPAAAVSPIVKTSAGAARRDQSEDGVLMLLIDEETQGGEVRYRYRVVSSALEMDYEEFFSDPLKAVDGGSLSTARAYVESVYKQVTERALRNADDLRAFERELRAIGSDLCRQLLPKDFARQLWEKRDDIGGILIRSWEPYIPWELLQVRNPDAQGRGADERFMAEYNLVRSLNGRARPRKLNLRNWSYVAAKYEFNYAKQVGAEIEYLTADLPQRRGITPSAIEPTIDGVLDALNNPDFDVLHIACHGEALHDDIDRSSLIIADRPGEQGTAEPVLIDARTVRAEAALWKRSPLVFLNACESGRIGASLTEWGGWPKTFWETGAGAFVGTSWAVRERPARVFAEGFYEALLDGQTLAQAAGAGRAAAKQLGDASWLAYKVYGQPGARNV
jgi:hypothetical protein